MRSTHSFRSLLLALALFLGVQGFAQNFDGFNYQAVIRNAAGTPLPNQQVGVRVIIVSGLLQPHIETFTVTTDAQGMIKLGMGLGVLQSGPAFSAIDWSNNNAWTYCVDVDITGGTNYQSLGCDSFKAVPFAMRALKSDAGPPSGWSVLGPTVANTNTGNVGIGTTTPAAKLHVEGTMRIADGTQGAAKLLTSDANGNASWQSFSASSMLGSGSVPMSGNLGCLAQMGSLATGSAPLSVAVSGDHAFVVNSSSNTLAAYSIADPTSSAPVSTVVTGTSPRSIAVSGNYAYVVNGGSNTLQVFDVSDLSVPMQLVATIATQNVPRFVMVNGNYAYVLNQNSNSMQVFDVVAPAAPVLLATVGVVVNHPISMAIKGNYAYVLSAGSGGDQLRIYDISDPSAPVFASSVGVGFYARSIAISGDYLYMTRTADDAEEIRIYDLGSPTAPSLLSTIATGTEPVSIKVVGNYAAVVNLQSDNMQVFDVSNPSAPSLSATMATGDAPACAAIGGDYACVANSGSNSLTVYRLFCPNLITMEAGTGELTAQPATWANYGSSIASTNSGNVGIGTNAPAAKLHVQGNVRIADGTQGAAKLLTSDANGNASWQNLSAGSMLGSGNVPASSNVGCLAQTGSLATGSVPLSVAVSGDHAFVVNSSSNTMAAYSIADPTSPALVSSVATGTSPRYIAVSDNHAYVVNGGSNTLQIFDISDLSGPMVLMATIATQNGPRFVMVNGNYAYVLNQNSNSMQVFNVAAPAAPLLVATVGVAVNGPLSMAIRGGYAYVLSSASGGPQLRIYDISDPSAPVFASYVGVGFFARSIAISGDYLYMTRTADDAEEMRIYNLGSPTAPALVSTIATGTEPVSIKAVGNYVVAVNLQSDNMQVFDVSNPSAPSLGATTATGDAPACVAIEGSYACVVNSGSNTLTVYKLFCPNLITMETGSGQITAQPVTWANYGNNIASTNSGRVGIGTNSPGDKLTVRTATSNYGFTHTDGTITVGSYVGGNGGGGWLGTKSNHDLHFFTNDSPPQMTLTTGGRVGIGTSVPEDALHVNGTVRLNDRIVFNSQSALVNWGPGALKFIMLSNVGDLNTGVTRMVIGDNGNVGIGPSLAPEQKLSVQTSTSQYGLTHTDGTVTVGSFVGGSTGGGWLGTKSNHPLSFFTNGGSAQVTLLTNGSLGVGTTAPSALLSVNGSANKIGGGSWSVFSDRRLKRDVRPYGDGLAAVLAIEPVHFRYNSLAKTDTTAEYVGVIAQELREVAPYMIDTVMIDGTDYLEVDNSAMTYMLINAIKELNARAQQQQTVIDGLRASNSAKDAKLDAVRVQLDANTRLLSELQGYLNAQGRK